MSVDRNGVEVLDRIACLDMLAADEVGRLAVLDGGQPLILPVNYGLDGETVVFRTASGAKLDAARRGARVLRDRRLRPRLVPSVISGRRVAAG